MTDPRMYLTDPARLTERLQTVLPGDCISAEPDDLTQYGKDWLNEFSPNPSLIVRPRTVDQVAALVKLSADEGIALVPSGGRTGLSGGATATQHEVIVSLERMNRISEVNQIDRTLRCEAGAITQKIQETAQEAGFFFPVDFASKGSSQIGGNIATNAGGIRVIRYGNIRDWVLSLQVVTGRGEILELNGSLFKNQTGYDLRGMFIGSEGTLGIITAATLKLTNLPKSTTRLLCGVPEIGRILDILQRARKHLPTVSVFEYFSDDAMQEVIAHNNLRNPLSERFPTYLLVEVEQSSAQTASEVEELFASFIEDGLMGDVVISQNSKQADELLAFRERIPETLSARHLLHKNDISVPVPRVPEFIEALQAKVGATYPDFKVVIFGHIGDGNLHVNVLKPDALQKDEFYRQCRDADSVLFDVVRSFQGSISAEHGVGLLKREFLSYSRSATEVALMRGVKQVFDPQGIFNPGKIFN